MSKIDTTILEENQLQDFLRETYISNAKYFKDNPEDNVYSIQMMIWKLSQSNSTIDFYDERLLCQSVSLPNLFLYYKKYFKYDRYYQKFSVNNIRRCVSYNLKTNYSYLPFHKYCSLFLNNKIFNFGAKFKRNLKFLYIRNINPETTYYELASDLANNGKNPDERIKLLIQYIQSFSTSNSVAFNLFSLDYYYKKSKQDNFVKKFKQNKRVNLEHMQSNMESYALWKQIFYKL